MIHYYQSDPRLLSDENLDLLMKEIEDSGALLEDPFDYDPEDWIYQAIERYDILRGEKNRRWEERNPEEAARLRHQREPMERVLATAIERIRPKIAELFSANQTLFDQLRR